MSNELLSDDTTWFPSIRESLLYKWQNDTLAADGTTSLACCLIDCVSLEDGHLSLSCSMSDESDQIEQLLSKTCFDDCPILFFRLLLFLLDEFTDRMNECYRMIQRQSAVRQPDIISVWTNRYAKHRTSILIQHHAQHLFEDDPLHQEHLQFARETGNITVIDFAWLRGSERPDFNAANGSNRAIVIIPPLAHYVDAAIVYYRQFITFALANPNLLKRFQSPEHLVL